MVPVVHPDATHLDELAGADHRRVADHRDEVSLAAGLDPQHAEPVLWIVKRHPLHQAGQGFRRRCLGDIRHSLALRQNRIRCGLVFLPAI